MKTSTACRRFAFALLVLVVFLGVGVRPGRAQVTSYTDPADFAAAAPGATAYTFSGAPPGGFSYEDTPYTSGPLTFDAYSIYVANDGTYGSGVQYMETTDSDIDITLSGATALSFTIGTYYGAQTVSISVNGAPATSVTETGGEPNTLFIGLTDTVPITSLTFSNVTQPGNEIDYTAFQVGTNAIPEPSTWALLGMGVAGLGLMLRCRRVRLA